MKVSLLKLFFVHIFLASQLTSSLTRVFCGRRLPFQTHTNYLPLHGSTSNDDGEAKDFPIEIADGASLDDDENMEVLIGDWDERVPKFNTLHLVGRVGNDPDPRYFDDGNVVINLSLACKRKYHYLERISKNIKNGDEETDWYGLEIWGQLAEVVFKYVDKGTRIGVLGSLEVDEWQDKETSEKRSKAKVIVRELEILESKAEADLRRSSQRGSSFYTSREDEYDPSQGRAGGFFD